MFALAFGIRLISRSKNGGKLCDGYYRGCSVNCGFVSCTGKAARGYPSNALKSGPVTPAGDRRSDAKHLRKIEPR